MSTRPGLFNLSAIGRYVGWHAKRGAARRGGHGSRSRYFILQGDTLEKIAERALGDVRLVGLLVTINRAQVRMVDECGAQIPYVQPGQTIYLPNTEEVEIYRSNFLTGKGAFKTASAEPESTVEVDCWDSENESKSHAVIEFPKEHDTTAQSSRFKEEECIFEPDQSFNTNVAVVLLADYCRVLSAESPQNANDFSIRLQAYVMETWRTIAAYYSRNGRIARVLYRIDGRRKQIDVELPELSVKEMAEDDFTRNWERHYRGYMMHKPSSLWLEFPAKTI